MTGGNVIDQFMWQWQQHFRISVEVLAEMSLEKIGARLDPQVMLVGLARETEARHPICIEPRTGPQSQWWWSGHSKTTRLLPSTSIGIKRHFLPRLAYSIRPTFQ